MSQSNAAAIRRRVPIDTSKVNLPTNKNQFQQQQQQQTNQVNVNSSSLTLPQVITLVDKRLITLEKFMQESKEMPKPVKFEPVPTVAQGPMQNSQNQEQNQELVQVQAFTSVIDEYNHRFELLAAEIDILKDIVLKLQSFTMEVNKTLMDERIHIFSDLGNSGNNENATDEFVQTEQIENPEESQDTQNIVLELVAENKDENIEPVREFI